MRLGNVQEMNKAVKLKPLDGTIIRAKRCQSSSHALTLAHRWSHPQGLAYAVTGLEMTVFRQGCPMNETNALKLARDVGLDV